MLSQLDRQELEGLRNLFYFSAPVRRLIDGRQGVVAKVPDDNAIAVVAFPVAVSAQEAKLGLALHMDREKVPCSELKRIFPLRPEPVGLSVI
jgi:hypothetical protein